MALTTEQKDSLIRTLMQMVELLGLTVEVETVDEQRGVTVQLRTEEPGRIIGRKGRSVESLEYLLNRILTQKYDEFPRIRIDVDGYQGDASSRPKPRREREGREGYERREGREGPPPRRRERPDTRRWEMMARDAVKEIKRWGGSKTLGPMDAASRRVVHVMLRDDLEVTADSGPDEGRGLKKIIIRPLEPGETHAAPPGEGDEEAREE